MISLVLPKVARARLRTHPSPSHQAKQKLLQGLRLRPGVAGQKRLNLVRRLHRTSLHSPSHSAPPLNRNLRNLYNL
jgi:hypothetical protein